MAKKKIPFDELIKDAKPVRPGRAGPPVDPNKRSTNRMKVDNAVDVELLRVWCPHLISCDFDRVRSVQLAFPTKEWRGAAAKHFATRLMEHPMFTDVMAAHIANLEDRLAHSERYVLDKLYRQAEANIYDYFREDDKGKLVAIPKHDLPKHLQQNVKKMKITNKLSEFRGERMIYEQHIELEIVDSFRAVALLGKNLGMFIEKVEIEFGKHTADRLEQALQRVRERKLENVGHQRTANQPRQPRSVH